MTRVLIVSGRASERRQLATLLGYSGFQVSEAADGPEALASAREHRPDLVVTEDLLPTMDAGELLRRLREQPAFGQTPIVLCAAAYREQEAHVQAEAWGTGFVLTRPFAHGAILRTVQSALGVPLAPAPGAPAAPQRSQFEQLGDAVARYTGALETVSLRLAALVQLGLELASERDPRRLLQSFCDAARDIVGARYAAIGMLEADGSRLGHFLTSGIDPETAARIGAPPAGRGVLGLLVSERKPLRLRDIARHPGSAGFPPHHPPMRSFLGVPVASPAHLHGRLYVTEKLGAEEFDEEDERLLMALAAQVAVSYENALQHQELARRAEALEREVAERRQAQEQLRLLDAALEAAANAIAVTDSGGDIVWANPAFTGLTGYALDECRGHNMRILKSGRHEDAFYADLWRTILSGQVWQREMVNRRKDGTLYVEDQTITPVYCQRGVITHFIAVKVDVTEKRRAEQALKDSEERYRTLAEAAQDDIFILDPEHRIRYVNACGARKLRRMPAEVIGRRLEELFPPEAAARLCASVDEVFATGGAVSKEDQVPFPGGQAWLGTSLVPLPGREREIEAVMGIARDITERKRAEEALQASEQRYRLLFDRNLAGVYRTRPDGRILDCNAAFARIFGCASPGEMQGLRAADLYPSPEERARFLALLRETGTLVNREWQGRRRDGSPVWLLENASLVAIGAEGEVIEGTLVDVSERRRLEEQLRQAQRMEAVGQLAGGVAHDFNNLLSVIGGYSELVLRALPPDSPLRRRVEEIQKAGERAATLTRQLLTFSRKEALEPTLVEVAAVVAAMEGMLRRLIPEDIRIVTVQPPRAAHVKADRGHIEQVILNLAVNARDAMPAGGRLVIETSLAELDPDFCRGHVGVVPGPYVLLAVSDTGTGMDAATRTHIFEPFFTTKEPGKGTGLGLATVYGIVRQWGGTIWVYSEPGHGATFKIYLPLAEGVVGTPPPRGAEPPTGSETILLVEDEPTLRAVASEVLQSLGYTVLEARDGPHALEVFSGHTGPVHLLLSDVVMPGLSGRELAERLLALRPELRVLFTSGYTDETLGGWAEGALLQKPYTSDALARKARQSLDAAPPTGAAPPSGAKGADARRHRK